MPLSTPLRIPFTWPYNPRAADSTRDPKRVNVMDEHADGKTYTLKRPGSILAYALGAATAQGVTNYNGIIYGVLNDQFKSVLPTPNSGSSGATWQISATPPWNPRSSFCVLTFKDRIWVLSGAVPPQTNADVWSSTDGVTWASAAGSAPWGGRNGFGACVLGNKMYVMGGYSTFTNAYANDVWMTEDGTNWEQINGGIVDGTQWLPRSNFGVVTSSSGMYVIGGLASAGFTYDDVWFSADGISWARQGGAFGWGNRCCMSCLYFQNKIFVIGGFNSAGVVQNDVWSSPDGLQWTQTNAAAFASGRFSMASCVYNNKMWIISGTNGAGYLQDVYSSDLTGTTWTLVTGAPGFVGRYAASAVVFRTPASVSTYRYPTMWLLGGQTGVLVNDVYRANLDTAVSTSVALNPTTTLQRYQFNSFQTGTRLLIKNQSNMWVYDSGNITVVTDAGYPTTTVPGIVVLGGSAYVMDPSGLIYNCALDNPYYWPALNVLGADYEDDAGVCLTKYLNYVVAFGTYTTQVFYDAGLATGSPLRPYLNANMKLGCANANTVCSLGATVVWVGQTYEGQRQVVMFNGLAPVVISTPAIDKMITGSANIGNFRAFVLNANGHQFYVLAGALSANLSLAYDFSTKEWFEWDTTAGIYDYFSAVDLTAQYTYLLHPSNGNVYAAGAVYYDDAGTPFTVAIRTGKYDAENKRKKFWGRLDIVGDQNPGTLNISYSDDDGQTYSTSRAVDMSTDRPALFRNGASRRRIFLVTQTDSNPMRLEALEQQFENGT